MHPTANLDTITARQLVSGDYFVADREARYQIHVEVTYVTDHKVRFVEHEVDTRKGREKTSGPMSLPANGQNATSLFADHYGKTLTLHPSLSRKPHQEMTSTEKFLDEWNISSFQGHILSRARKLWFMAGGPMVFLTPNGDADNWDQVLDRATYAQGYDEERSWRALDPYSGEVFRIGFALDLQRDQEWTRCWVAPLGEARWS